MTPLVTQTVTIWRRFLFLFLFFNFFFKKCKWQDSESMTNTCGTFCIFFNIIFFKKRKWQDCNPRGHTGIFLKKIYFFKKCKWEDTRVTRQDHSHSVMRLFGYSS